MVPFAPPAASFNYGMYSSPALCHNDRRNREPPQHFRRRKERKDVSTKRRSSTKGTVSHNPPNRFSRGGPAPPVGPALGQYRLNLMAFCKDFNARTQKYKPDTPMVVKITAYKDNTFEFTVKSPLVSWYLKKAVGIEQGSSRPGHVVALSVTLKHVYEIANVKQTDPGSQHLSLEAISKSIIGAAKTMGIEVVIEL